MASDAKGARRFVFHECLGSGSYGEVYRATLLAPGGVKRDVAVKMLQTGLDPRSQALQRLQDEGQLLSLVRHPAILRVFDMAVIEDRVCLVTEFVRGADLADHIGRAPIPASVALEIVSQLADALHAAWTTPLPDSGRPLNLVHRDIKPSNIRLGQHGQVKLLDFGVAKSTQVKRHSHTATRGLVGTFSYMSPERLAKQDDLTPASDLYSLGLVLFEALRGASLLGRVGLRKHFQFAQDRALHDLFIKRQVDALDTPSDIRALLSDLLAGEPDDRPEPSAVADLAEDLADAVGGPSLRVWLERHPTPEKHAVVGSMDGQTRDESFSFDEDEPLPPVPDPTQTGMLPQVDLVGRQREWAMLDALLTPGLTLLKGPGGIGKSRLAQEVCSDPLRHRMVSVASARSLDALVQAVALGLDMNLTAGAASEQVNELGQHLADSQLQVLVIDNVEQLETTANDAFSSWRAQAPQLCLLITSRRGLPLDGVRTLTLNPLTDDDVLELYTRRARERVPDYRPDAKEIDEIQAFGRAHGGLPLAVELAASRVQSVSPAQFGHPSRGLNTSGSAPEHSARSMHECLLRTWELLSPDEQRGWLAATCFADTFVREMWDATMGPGDHDATWLALSDLEIIRAGQTGYDTRFTQLVTQRQFAREVLDRHPLAAELWGHFCRSYSAAALQRNKRAETTGALQWHRAERPNLMEVLVRGPEFAPDAVIEIAVAMEVLLQAQGSPAEQLKMMTALLDTGEGRLRPDHYTWIMSRHCVALATNGQLEACRTTLERTRSRLPLEEATWHIRTVGSLLACALLLKQWNGALTLGDALVKAAEQARELDMSMYVGIGHYQTAYALERLGQLDAGRVAIQKAHATFQRQGNSQMALASITLWANLLRRQHQTERAQNVLSSHIPASGSPTRFDLHHHALQAQIHLDLGQPAQAMRLAERTLQIAESYGQHELRGSLHETLGIGAFLLNDVRAAREHLIQAETAFDRQADTAEARWAELLRAASLASERPDAGRQAMDDLRGRLDGLDGPTVARIARVLERRTGTEHSTEHGNPTEAPDRPLFPCEEGFFRRAFSQE